MMGAQDFCFCGRERECGLVVKAAELGFETPGSSG